MTEVFINGQKIGEATDVQFEFDHADAPPVANITQLERTDYEITGTAKLTRSGRKLFQFMRELGGEAAQAGFMIVHKGRGRYTLQRFQYGKRGNKRNIYPYNQKGKK